MGAVQTRLRGTFRTILKLIRHPAAAPLLGVALYGILHLMPMYTTLPSIFLGKVRYGGMGTTQVWMALDDTGRAVQRADYDISPGVVAASVRTVVRYEGFAFDLVGTLDHTIAVASDGASGWPASWSAEQVGQARALVAAAVVMDGRPKPWADLVRRGDGQSVVVNEPAHLANGVFFALAGAFAISCLWLPAHCGRLLRAIARRTGTLWRTLGQPATSIILGVTLVLCIAVMPTHSAVRKSVLGGPTQCGTQTATLYLETNAHGELIATDGLRSQAVTVLARPYPMQKGFAFDRRITVNYTVLAFDDSCVGWPPQWTNEQIASARNQIADECLVKGNPAWACDLVRIGDGMTTRVVAEGYVGNAIFFALLGAFVLSCAWIPRKISRGLRRAAPWQGQA